MRYPLHLPVVIKTDRQEMHARSENISLGGILLLSDRLIPEGATVEVAVGVQHTADPGILLSARGRVLRAQAKSTGDFAVAIRLERSFQLPLAARAASAAAASTTQSPERKKSSGVFYRAPYITAWHTET